MPHRIRIGVIGAGAERGWARSVHLPALAASPQYDIVAVAATTADKARAAARQWGAGHAYADAYELIADPGIDLVTVAVQLPQRDGLVEAVVAAGKHVYCEWPLAIDADTATRFRDRAVRAGVRHAVGLQSRHHPAVRQLRDLVADGRVGEVLSASLSYSLSTPDRWPQRYAALFDATKGVNHLAVVGGHSMDMFRHAVGGFTELSARLTTRVTRAAIEGSDRELSVTSPDQITVHGVLESGAAASVHLVTGGPRGAGHRLEVHGRRGRLLLLADDDSLVGPRLTLLHGHGHDEPTPLPLPDRYLPRLTGVPPAVSNVHQVYADLAEAIRTGAPLEPDFDTAAAMHRTLDAIKASDRQGDRQHLTGG
ncbi:Gfo/Idh/MocA family protein [Streptacidiphilus sp. P02-A3a]|uniref:Gfo/Idh/MocA family protein n=1 Tax=Streptacidiphilus sp. P02-A3a TaxID=2704468 RepID=UPI0015F92820|nr:Gfo/Idh/MocA family oxidoreductase [Streptacidiphilus sp. P02-A3a]QMU73033.1 Gfo/Idh/MocA family oxidoreductase [Streptacidiphilus sp. P02-A3a]